MSTRRRAPTHELARFARAAGAALSVGAAMAEEGVWTFDNLPAKALQAKYGFATLSTSLTALRMSACASAVRPDLRVG
jgi:hypothetical protein